MRSFVALAILLMFVSAGCRKATAPAPAGPPLTKVTQTPLDTPALPVKKAPTLIEVPGRTPLRYERSLRGEPALVESAGAEDTCERDAIEAQRQLSALAAMIAAKSSQQQDYMLIASDEFGCGSLRSTTAEVFRSEALSIRRGTKGQSWSLTGQHRGAAGLEQALSELLKPLSATHPIAARLTLISPIPTTGEVATQVEVQISGQTREGRLQINARWNCVWQLNRQPMRLASIAVLEHEEVQLASASRQLFSDCTAAVLDHSPSWKAQLAWGVDDWRARREPMLAPAALGWQGLAIGDANGDGRDDVYLCAGAGLPNRLLLQNADGTALEIAAEVGVDWLDDCASALFIDYDNDGDQDLVVACEREVLIHQSDGKSKYEVVQAIALAARPMSLAAADYDDDGWLDLVVCGYAPVEELQQAIMGQPASMLSAAGAGGSLLLHNEHDGQFRDVTTEVGLSKLLAPFALSANWQDIDHDGDPDLLITHAFSPNRIYRNDAGGFTPAPTAEGLPNLGCTTSLARGDFNSDGEPDLYLGAMLDAAGRRVFASPAPPQLSPEQFAKLRATFSGGTLLVSGDLQAFRDVGAELRASLQRTTWGLRSADVNNDGQLDLLAAGGMISGPRERDLASYFWRRVVLGSPASEEDAVARDVHRRYDLAWRTMTRLVAQGHSWDRDQRGICLLNTNGQGFADASAAVGFDFAADGRAIATTDWDSDGDLDVWLTSRSAPSVRFAQNNSSGRFLSLALQGATCNRDAIGARVSVKLQPSGRRLVQVLQAGDGFLSQSSKIVHFGLPAGEDVAEVAVRWPGGQEEKFAGARAGKAFRLMQNSGQAVPLAGRSRVNLAASDEPPPAPPQSGSTFLLSRLPLPLLKYRNFDEKGVELGGKTNLNRLIVLWSSSLAPSLNNLEVIKQKAFDLRLVKVDVVALSVDDVPLGKLFSPAAHRVITEMNFPFAAGMADTRLVNHLEAVQQSLLGLEMPLTIPLAVLLDEHGRVAALYRGTINPQRVVEDARALAVDIDTSLSRACSLPGRWRTEPRPISPLRLAEQMNEADVDDATIAYVQMLIAQGHDRAAGYELLQPDKLYFLLGTLFEARGRGEEAAEAFRVVLKVDEEHDAARRRLASIAGRLGRYEEAADVLRDLVQANPEDIVLRHEWAVRLADAGYIQQSLAQHREVLARYPDAIATANNLAWLLATNPNPRIRKPEEALQLARKVCEATEYKRPDALDTLAAAYGALGRFDGAVTTAQKALDLARSQRQSLEQIQVIEYHLQFYQEKQPFFEEPKRDPPERYDP